jgi:hypothetical protein
VIERNLVGVRTYSVGLVRAGSMRVSYFGTQRRRAIAMATRSTEARR